MCAQGATASSSGSVSFLLVPTPKRTSSGIHLCPPPCPLWLYSSAENRRGFTPAHALKSTPLRPRQHG